LFGPLCCAGLVFSIWPWHLHPVPVAGVAFTAVLGLAVVGRRRWTRPRWPTGASLAGYAAGVGVVVVVLAPFVPQDLGARLGLFVQGEDLARHVVLTETIGAVGGYAFLHPDASAQYLPES